MLNSNCIQCTKLSDLPNEILLETFKYLPSEDKKAARIVCRRWFDVCCTSSILMNEVFTCNGVYMASDIYKLLGKSKRHLLNLRFYNVKFPNSEENLFWQQNGYKIRSLDLIDCSFQVDIFERIIHHCEYMQHLSLTFSSQHNQDVSYLVFHLKRLIKNGIIRGNLKSLEINLLDSRWITNCLMHYLFLIFTKVKKFKISCTVVDTNFEAVSVGPSELLNTNKFTFSPVLNYMVVARDQIESLKLNFPTNEFSTNFIHRIFEEITNMTKLTELSINMRGVPSLKWTESFFRSDHLTSLEYCMKMDNSSEKFLLRLLQNHPHLQHLKVSFFNTLKVTSIFFEKLMLSNLRSLYIEDTLIVLDSELNALKNYSPNEKLRDLSVYTERLHAEAQLFFWQNFQNLRHLELSNLTDDLLQSAFKYQTKLRSLILHDCDLCSTYGFMGTDNKNELTDNASCFSFKRFSSIPQLCSFPPKTVHLIYISCNVGTLVSVYQPNCAIDCDRIIELECLELLSCSAGNAFPKIFSSDSILPNLKYLRFNVSSDSKLNHLDLLVAVDRMPSLEGLYLYYGHFTTFDTWLQICAKLHRLRYLYIRSGIGETKFRDSDYQKLFLICPSLRAVVHDSNSGQILACHYLDTIKNEVHSKQGGYLYPVCLPKIGEFVVHWMNF